MTVQGNLKKFTKSTGCPVKEGSFSSEEQIGAHSGADTDLDYLGYGDYKLLHQIGHEEDQLLQDDSQGVLREVHGEESFKVHGEEKFGVYSGADTDLDFLGYGD